MFLRYIGEVANALSSVTGTSSERLRRQLLAIARRRTELADREFDEHGKLIKRTRKSDPLLDGSTVILESSAPRNAFDETLFDGVEQKRIRGKPTRAVPRRKKPNARARKRQTL